jgi:hypothetical protein
VATVTQFWCNPVWQAYGQTAWNVAWGDRDFYWGFSARPYQANDIVRLDAASSNSDNNLNQSTDLVVTITDSFGGTPRGQGGLIRLTAIKVQNP